MTVVMVTMVLVMVNVAVGMVTMTSTVVMVVVTVGMVTMTLAVVMVMQPHWKLLHRQVRRHSRHQKKMHRSPLITKHRKNCKTALFKV